MEKESPCVKTIVLKNAPKEEHFTQTGSTLAHIPSEDGVGDKRMKVPKGEVAN